jgi:putative transcriptional regulator
MRNKDFDNLVTSIRQAGRIRRGEMKPSRVTQFAPPDIRAIRRRLGQSQAEFARMIGVSVATLQNWEQGRDSRKAPPEPCSKSPPSTPKPSPPHWPVRARGSSVNPKTPNFETETKLADRDSSHRIKSVSRSRE